MLTVKEIDNNLLNVKFKYYPDYIDRIRMIKGSRYCTEDKSWTIPKESFNSFRILFEGEIVYETPLHIITGEESPDFSYMYEFDDDTILDDVNYKIEPYNYQKFGIKLLADRCKKYKMGFTADSPGLGKTFQAMCVFDYFSTIDDSIKNIVIVVKKSVKEQWRDEIRKFIDFDGEIYIADNTKAKRIKMYEAIKKDNNKKVIIINYHLLLKDIDYIKSDFIVLDETHVAKKYNGDINKACRKAAKGAKYCLFMTGTPIMSKLEDFYGIISIFDGKYIAKNHKEFKERYVTEYYNGKYTEVVGLKNIDELREKVQRILLRRTPNEVAMELPSVKEINVNCSINNSQRKILEIANKEKKDIEDNIENLTSRYSMLTKTNDMEEARKVYEKKVNEEGKLKGLISVCQTAANCPMAFKYSKSPNIKRKYKDFITLKSTSSKVEKLIDLVESISTSQNKVIIFSKYETTVNYLSDVLNKNKIKNVIYTGSMNETKRNNTVDVFKNNNDCIAFIATDAAAEAINLNVASNVINFDLPFNNSIYTQRYGRSRRAGSKHSVTFVYNLLTEESIDYILLEKIEKTKESSSIFVELDENQSKVLRELNN